MSLNDEALLATDLTFIQRVRASVLASAVAISNEGPVTNHAQRDQVAVNALTNPDAWKMYFAATIATDPTVIGFATSNGTVTLTAANLAAQAAFVTDASINNAVSAQWNSFFTH